ncbi:MAG: tyrosine-type recombinase/integrase [Sporichthyaceae bacterium]
MGHIVPTSAGSFRANWRDPAGQQRSKTFDTRREARAHLAQVELDLARGSYHDPRAGKVPFKDHAKLWFDGRNLELSSTERVASVLRVHLLPRWGDWPLVKIDHLSVQAWVGELGRDLAPRTVSKITSTMAMIMRSAVRARIIPANPCDHLELPRPRPVRGIGVIITREELFAELLPAVPQQHRALVATAAMAGLRWGECVGLAWKRVDLDAGELTVAATLVEVNGHTAIKPYPKSRAGARTIVLPPLLTDLLHAHRAVSVPNPDDLVFTTGAGAPWRRTNFRSQVWLPALAAAGIPPGMRFHDLRHCYATWLVSEGVPINEVQRLLGHEQASTTLDRYTHPTRGHDAHVRAVFAASADFPLTFGPEGSGQGPGSLRGPAPRRSPSPQVAPPGTWNDRGVAPS